MALADLPIIGRMFGKRSPQAEIDRLMARVKKLNIKARFDSAQTTTENQRHWANADNLSADAAASEEVRRILRCRSRYEVANNSYARGILRKQANLTIGRGPRLVLKTPNTFANQLVEKSFARWSKAIRFGRKLRTMRIAKSQDGEAFGILISNPKVRHQVKLDVRVIEADRVTTPGLLFDRIDEIDGIKFDRFGNPFEYNVLDVHPGSTGVLGQLPSLFQATTIKADRMLHWFREDRPGQLRGLPEITAALPLFSHLRRYTLAVITAAETAADFAGVMFTDAPPNGDAAAVEPLELVELDRNLLTTLPEGWKLGQIKAEQPSTGYSEFKREIVNEISAGTDLASNVASGDSSKHNYASGRLDHLVSHKTIDVERDSCEDDVVDRVFLEFMREIVLLGGDFTAARVLGEFPDHEWRWDGHPTIDPARESKAVSTALADNVTTLEQEYAAKGQDWREQLEQRGREIALMNDLGIPITTSVAILDEDGDLDEEV